MVEFHVLRCAECQAFQVLQVTKTAKWTCKVCGQKQSIKKVYGQGTGADCRRHVQKLNSLSCQASWSSEEQSLVSASEASIRQSLSFHQNTDSVLPKAAQSSHWFSFLETPNDQPHLLNVSSETDDNDGSEVKVQVFTDWAEFQESRKGRRRHRSEMRDEFPSTWSNKSRKILDERKDPDIQDTVKSRHPPQADHYLRMSRPSTGGHKRSVSRDCSYTGKYPPPVLSSSSCSREVHEAEENLSPVITAEEPGSVISHPLADNLYTNRQMVRAESARDVSQLCQGENNRRSVQDRAELKRKMAPGTGLTSKWGAFLEAEAYHDDDDYDDRETNCENSYTIAALNNPSILEGGGSSSAVQAELSAENSSIHFKQKYPHHSDREVNKGDEGLTCLHSPVTRAPNHKVLHAVGDQGLFDLGYDILEGDL